MILSATHSMSLIPDLQRVAVETVESKLTRGTPNPGNGRWLILKTGNTFDEIGSQPWMSRYVPVVDNDLDDVKCLFLLHISYLYKTSFYTV